MSICDTATRLEDNGFSADLLKQAGGSFKAQMSICDTATSLEDNGYSADLLKKAGGSFKAQVRMLSTLDSLEEIGFDEKQSEKLFKGYNKNGANQELLLININKLLSKNFNFEEVSCILAGSDRMGKTIQNAVTQLCLHLKEIEQKPNEYIVHFVRQCRKDTNRTFVANEFLSKNPL